MTKKETKTIIGFDSWTIGSHHFVRLASEFKRQGYTLLLIHIGSWGHDKKRPKEELIGELLVRDISYYEGTSFEKILKQENPSAVLFLSVRAFAHMAFNRYAHHMNIPTCHLYHGLVKVQAVESAQQAYNVNYLQHLQLLLTRSWKNIFLLIPCYMRSLIYTSASLQSWHNLFLHLLEKAIAYQKQKFLLDTKTTIGCVYTNADVEHMNRNYDIAESNIHVVGNPDLMMFDLKTEDINIIPSNKNSEKSEILYIDTALSKSGVIFSSDDDFIEHLITTKNSLDSQGYHLIVKLHPAHNQSNVPTVLEDLGIELCTNVEFVRRIKSAIAVIVEPSSAAIIPALIGLPVLLAQYGKLNGQLYGEVLTTYPRARMLERIEQVSEILEKERDDISASLVKQWIAENIGPLPAEDMPKRVVDAVTQMILIHHNL